MEFQAVQHSVDKLIQWIRSGRMALPDFQREFVWNPARVVELLDSVARHWPIGSLLLLSGPQPFGIREIAAAPKLRGSDLDYYVLDGQQRLTALYHAITDVSDFAYFVDFSALSRDEEEYISWEKRKNFEKRYSTLSTRAVASIALIKDIWDLDQFYAWIEHVPDARTQRAYVSLRESRLSGLQSKVYKLMAIELDAEIQLEALARIFETLNRTGVKLNAFDLMVAILYPTGFHLRDRWEQAKAEFDLLHRYDVDPIEVLKLASLLIRKELGKKAAKGVRQGDLLELEKRLLTQYWGRAVSLLSDALTFARSHLGVYCADAIPAWSMILTIAALMDSGIGESKIKSWFWSSAFAQTYSQAANTIVVADADAIWAGRIFEFVSDRSEAMFDVFSEPARKNGLALRAMASFMARNGALDPVTGVRLVAAETLAYRLVDESGYLRRLDADAAFDQVIFLTEESDRKMNRAETHVSQLGIPAEVIADRLSSQFLTPHWKRDSERFSQCLRAEAGVAV